jgi:hypothetical protein
MKKKIIILTDSIALPRKYNEGLVQYEDTYIFKLKESLTNYEIINLSIGGGSIKDITKQINYYKNLIPICVILHCGIVDAAPRAFGRIELEVIRKLRLLRLTKPLVPFLRKYRAHHYTNCKEFEKKIIKMKKEFKTPCFFAIGILPSNSDYEKLLPGITKSINLYNQILSKNTNFISVEDIAKNCILEDFHHINASGQLFLFKKILNKLKENRIN